MRSRRIASRTTLCAAHACVPRRGCSLQRVVVLQVVILCCSCCVLRRFGWLHAAAQSAAGQPTFGEDRRPRPSPLSVCVSVCVPSSLSPACVPRCCRCPSSTAPLFPAGGGGGSRSAPSHVWGAAAVSARAQPRPTPRHTRDDKQHAEPEPQTPQHTRTAQQRPTAPQPQAAHA